MKISKFLVLIFIISTLFACSSSVDFVRNEKRLKLSNKEIAKTVINNSIKFKALKVKRMKVIYDFNGKKTSFNGSARFISDSVIWMSFNAALGIEVLRIKMTKDSVSLMDRYHKQYSIFSYDKLSDKIGTKVNFDLVQSFLIAKLMNYEQAINHSVVHKLRYNKNRYSNYHVLSLMSDNKYIRKKKRFINSKKIPKNNRRVFNQEVFIYPVTFNIHKVFITDIYNNWNINISYDSYKKYETKLLPSIINLDFKSKKSNLKCNIKYSGIQFEDSLSIPFRIPKKYKHINQ